MTTEQKSLFDNEPNVKLCERCAKRCRVAAERNPNAALFVKGDARTGRYCAECVVVDFFKHCDIGPASALGAEFFGSDFKADCLRLPHVQSLLREIITVAAREKGAELTWEEIDWDEVIANWHLPFPKKGRKKRR